MSSPWVPRPPNQGGGSSRARHAPAGFIIRRLSLPELRLLPRSAGTPDALAAPAARQLPARSPTASRPLALALARALTRARSHSHCLSPRALTLKHVLSHFAHALTLTLACSHVHTCARTHRRTFTSSDSPTRATRTSSHTLTPARLPRRGAGTAGESAGGPTTFPWLT